jgi:hypothetical protein
METRLGWTDKNYKFSNGFIDWKFLGSCALPYCRIVSCIGDEQVFKDSDEFTVGGWTAPRILEASLESIRRSLAWRRIVSRFQVTSECKGDDLTTQQMWWEDGQVQEVSAAMWARYKLQVFDQDVEPSATDVCSFHSQEHHHFDAVEPHQQLAPRRVRSAWNHLSSFQNDLHDCNDRSFSSRVRYSYT